MAARVVFYDNKEIYAFIWKLKIFKAYMGVHISDNSIRTLGLSDPYDPECNIATYINCGPNFDIIFELCELIEYMPIEFQKCLTELLNHWERSGFERERLRASKMLTN